MPNDEVSADNTPTGLKKILPEMGWTPAYWVVSQMPGLSFRALGLHGYLMSLPEGWLISADRIAKLNKGGREAIRSMLRELEEFGLLERVLARDEQGKVATRTVVYAIPKSDLPAPENSVPGVTRENTTFPQVGPGTGKPGPGESGSFKRDIEEEIHKKKDSSLRSGRAPARAMPIPEDYEPSPALRQWAWDKHRLRSEVVDAEIEIFKDHHIAKGSAMKSWDAAARTWLARVNSFSRPASNGNGSTNGSKKASSDDRVEQALRAGRELAAEIAAGGSFGLIEGGDPR